MQHSTKDKRLIQFYQKQDQARTLKWSLQNPDKAAKQNLQQLKYLIAKNFVKKQQPFLSRMNTPTSHSSHLRKAHSVEVKPKESDRGFTVIGIDSLQSLMDIDDKSINNKKWDTKLTAAQLTRSYAISTEDVKYAQQQPSDDKTQKGNNESMPSKKSASPTKERDKTAPPRNSVLHVQPVSKHRN